MTAIRLGLNVIGEMPSWYDDALCAQVDPAIFFPANGGTTRPGRSVCAACPVLDQCLEYALATDELWGIWGGTTESERLRLRRARNREAS